MKINPDPGVEPVVGVLVEVLALGVAVVAGLDVALASNPQPLHFFLLLGLLLLDVVRDDHVTCEAIMGN